MEKVCLSRSWNRVNFSVSLSPGVRAVWLARDGCSNLPTALLHGQSLQLVVFGNVCFSSHEYKKNQLISARLFLYHVRQTNMRRMTMWNRQMPGAKWHQSLMLYQSTCTAQTWSPTLSRSERSVCSTSRVVFAAQGITWMTIELSKYFNTWWVEVLQVPLTSWGSIECASSCWPLGTCATK